MTALATVLLIVSVLGGGAGTVYASQSSMPDDLLYPVKTLSEDVRLSLADEDTQIELLEEFTDRRIEEISTLLEEDVDTPDQVMDRLQTHLDQSIDLVADETNNEELEADLLQLQDRLQTHDRIMDQIHLNDPEAVKQADMVQNMLQNQLHLVEDGLTDPLTFRLRSSNPNEDVPDNVPGIVDDSDVIDTPDAGDGPTTEATPDAGTDAMMGSATQASADKVDRGNASSTETSGSGNGNGNGSGNGQGNNAAATEEVTSTTGDSTKLAQPTISSATGNSSSQGNGNGANQGNNDDSGNDSDGGGGGGGGGGGKGK